MDFKEFATNYLNPIYLMYRITFLMIAFATFVFSIPMFTNYADRSDMIIVLVMAILLHIGIKHLFGRNVYLLYGLIPPILISIAVTIRGEEVVKEGILRLPMAMCWCASFLLAYNGLRSWGYGVSMNEINNRTKRKIKKMKK